MDEPLRALDWWYPENEHHEPEAEAVLAEINGWKTAPESGNGPRRRQVPGQGRPPAPRPAARRLPHPQGRRLDRLRLLDLHRLLRLGRGEQMPSPRAARTLRARVGVRVAERPAHHLQPRQRAPRRQPWSERKKLVWWDEKEGQMDRRRRAGFPEDQEPPATGRRPARRDWTPSAATRRSCCTRTARRGSTSPRGLAGRPDADALRADGIPAQERALPAPDESGHQLVQPPGQQVLAAGRPAFPYVLTTYRLTEHHTTGAMSRFLPHLNELMPELFVEMSVELAAELGVLNGDPWWWLRCAGRWRRGRWSAAGCGR